MDTCKSPASTCASISQMLLALALSIMATNISAQTVEGETSDTALETLVVTAQRRAQNVQDVPASITALSSETLERMQITSINQLSSAAPNLQVTQEFGPGSPATFTIRGVSSANFGPNQSEPVAFYIDEGIRLLPQFEAMPMFDIEHQETPSPFTPLGMKGVGESGVGATLGALCSAIENAFPEVDVELSQLPLTPDRVWKAIRKARSAAAAGPGTRVANAAAGAA